jgi:hypothetical protein
MAESTSSFDGGNGKSAPEFLADQAKQVGQELGAKASEAAEAVKHTAQYEVDEIGTAAKEIASDATAKLKSAMTEHKVAGADYLANVSRAMQRAAGEFERDVPQAARYIRRAGTQLASAADALRERDPRELVAEVENLARRQPALFFGGAVILGFAALRFLKSASPSAVEVKGYPNRAVGASS